MRSSFARILAFSIAVSLSLPPGWCCFLGVSMPVAQTRLSCCGCRCTMPKPAEPTQNPRPPLDLSRCCCADRNAVESSDSHRDLPVAVSTVLVVVDFDRVTGSALCPAPPVPAIRCHLLKCVWLC